KHRAAAVDGPAVAIEPDHVDVGRPPGDAFLENACALVDHRIHHALEDLLVADRTPLAAEPGQRLVDQLFDLGVGQRGARAAFIFVVALAGLLAEAAGLAQRIRDFALDAAVFPRAPADIEAGEIAHRKRTHRHAELGHDGIDLLRQRAFEQELFRLLAALRQHAVADETIADTDHRRHLADLA